MATGGLAVPQLGASAFGYRLAEQFGLAGHDGEPQAEALGAVPFATPLLDALQRRSMPVGLELYSVRTELTSDLMGTVAAVGRMGYQVVEFYAPYLDWTVDTAKCSSSCRSCSARR